MKSLDHLNEMQRRVTQEDATEPPFRNEYWDHHEAGIYVDVVSGEPLFCSLDKFNSGTGWPSFTRPIKDQGINTKRDDKLGMTRTEVRSCSADSHLGHVFDDGPGPTGQRYCINSAALRFVPLAELPAQGYGEYAKLFETETLILAGGCFWGMQELIRKLSGVTHTEVGYTGGELVNPKYEDVKTGTTYHAEAIKVTYLPYVLSLEDLLRFFFRIHDPTTLNRQGNDHGTQYRSAIFFKDPEHKKRMEQVIQEVADSGFWSKPIATQLESEKPFYRAEDFHQDYLQHYPNGYTCHFFRE